MAPWGAGAKFWLGILACYLLFALPVQAAPQVWLSPDGNFFCRVTARGFSLWDMLHRQRVASWSSVPDPTSDPVFNAQSTELLTLAADGRFWVTRLPGGKIRLQGRIPGFSVYPYEGRRPLALHPQGQWLALNPSGEVDLLYQLTSPLQAHPLKGLDMDETPDLLAYSPDGKALVYTASRLAYTRDDGVSHSVLRPSYEIYLYEPLTGVRIRHQLSLEPDDSLQGLAFSPDSQLLVLGAGSGLIAWDLRKQEVRWKLSSAMMPVAFRADGQQLAVVVPGPSHRIDIRIYDPITGHLLQVLKSMSVQITSVSFGNGNTLLAANGDGIQRWNLSTGASQQWLFQCSDSENCSLSGPQSGP